MGSIKENFRVVRGGFIENGAYEHRCKGGEGVSPVVPMDGAPAEGRGSAKALWQKFEG